MKNVNGSCLLLLSLISSVILIYALNAWQNAIFTIDIARQKYEFEYNFRNIESLHNYGLFLYIDKFQRITKKGNAQRFVLYKGVWPLQSHKTSKALIILSSENDVEKIQSRMKNYFIESKIKKISDNNKILLYDLRFQIL